MRRMILIVAAVVAVVVGGGLVYLWLSGGSGEPSTALTTPPIAADTTTTSTEPEDSATTTTSTPPTTDTPSTTDPDESATESITFVITTEGSRAMFALDEELRGESNRVIGTTSEVAGQFRFDPADLESAEVSPIVVNARTFETDSSTRDRAIRGPVILDSASDEFELITFTPASVDGLAGAAAVGDTATFTVAGDLTVKGETRPVTFDVEVSWVEEDRLEGSATTVVNRTDFGIGIPSVATVANVSEEVELTVSFVATAG